MALKEGGIGAHVKSSSHVPTYSLMSTLLCFTIRLYYRNGCHYKSNSFCITPLVIMLPFEKVGDNDGDVQAQGFQGKVATSDHDAVRL